MTGSDRVVDLDRWRAAGEVTDRASDGRGDDDDVEDDGADMTDIAGHVAELQASNAVAIAAAIGYYEPDIDAEIVTALRFQACTGACADEDGYGIAQPLVDAADYLIAHPELSVVATNWHTRPCDTVGEHLIFEVTVRSSEPAPTGSG